jgi:hypothetical protein
MSAPKVDNALANTTPAARSAPVFEKIDMMPPVTNTSFVTDNNRTRLARAAIRGRAPDRNKQNSLAVAFL